MEIGTGLNLKDYLYELPEYRIAKFPLARRDSSKLLVYEQGQTRHESFKDISNFLPAGSTLFFNNTKVIPARLLFFKGTGAEIEIFLLQPKSPTPEIARAMQVEEQCSWICMIRNLKKWKNEEVLKRVVDIEGKKLEISAKLIDNSSQTVALKWNQPIAFASMIALLGEVPLPPYLKRKAENSDRTTYQTIYSKAEGAVAAPTAGLHFTDQVLGQLQQKKIATEFLTLHVSAGTFQPIKEEEIIKHPMHAEQIILSRNNIEAIGKAKKIIAVGTTSMRSLESLYWFGLRLHLEKHEVFFVEKLYPYKFLEKPLPSRNEIMDEILQYMEQKGLDCLSGATEIYIFPGYTFRMCDGLITNFHQPGSTLILLVAAFLGEDWREVYTQALENNYRFLSYGDSSLLLP